MHPFPPLHKTSISKQEAVAARPPTSSSTSGSRSRRLPPVPRLEPRGRDSGEPLSSSP